MFTERTTETALEEAARLAQSADHRLRPLAQLRVVNPTPMPGQIITPTLAGGDMVVVLGRMSRDGAQGRPLRTHEGTWSATVVASQNPGAIVGATVTLSHAEARRSQIVRIQPAAAYA